MKPIALQLYSVREIAKTDFYGVLKQIASFGYKGVEPAGLHGKDPKELRKVLDDLGLTCCSAHGPLVTRENLQEQVDVAKALGYDLLVSGKGGDDFKTADGIRRAAEQFQQAAQLLKPFGMKMGYHNHWWEMNPVDGRLGYELFLEQAPGVFSELDVYWASNFGKVDVPALLAKHAKRVPLLHIKDGPLVERQPHTAVGAGKMDMPAVVQAADDRTLRWLIVELDHCATDMLTAVRESCQYLMHARLGEGRP